MNHFTRPGGRVLGGLIMSNTICICCAGRMTAGSPRNPNICLSCEQLLDDDCAALEKLMADTSPAEVPPTSRLTGEPAPEMVYKTLFGGM